MYLIKRTKAAPPGPPGLVVVSQSPAVHWAAGIGPEGVTVWTPDRDKAAQFERARADQLVEAYDCRSLAGLVEVEDVNPAPVEAPQLAAPDGPRPNEDDMRLAVAEIDRQRLVISQQAAEIDGQHLAVVRQAEEITRLSNLLKAKEEAPAPAPAPVPAPPEEPKVETEAETGEQEHTVFPQHREPRRPRR